MEENDGDVRADPQLTAPHALGVGGEDWSTGNVAQPTWSLWRSELSEVGGRSPLLHFVDARSTRIELSTTHPGGLARFITGAATLLSNLIRDDVALRSARIAADQIAAKGLELSTTRGIDAVQLGIGIARWTNAGEEFCGPILLRPLAIRRAGRDFELKLRGGPRLNPAFARALEEQFGISLDAAAFVALTDAGGTFKPNAVIDQLRGLTGHLTDFAVSPRLVVSTFADVAHGLLADATDLAHPVLDALGGNAGAKYALGEANAAVEPSDPDRREPSTDTLLLDADAEQEQVIAQVEAGNSLVVKTMPGAGGTQTVVNAIGALVRQNKRVLVVSPRRATLQGIADRVAEVGLTGLTVTPRSLRRDVIQAITRNEKAQRPGLGDIDEALVRLRGVLIDYRGALGRPDGILGVSVLDCVTELSRLALLPDPPSTTARLPRSAVEALALDRSGVAQTMVDAARLGEFRYGPNDSPWYGASFADGEAAHRAHSVAKRLHDEELPRLLVRAGELIGSTHLRPFESVAELGTYLKLLTDLRDTLDRFQPSVFDRSLSELIAATAPRRESPTMSSGNRRRLKALAKEYVRPGMHVGDLHDALTRVQQQRMMWQRYVAAGVTPEVPVGIADVQVAWQQVSQDLAELDIPLDRSGDTRLAALPIDELGSMVEGLAAESDVLDSITERSDLLSTLRHLELDGFLGDLAERHVPEDRVAAELELAWWRSALDGLLESERALLGANTGVLERLEADFRLVDEAHASGSSQLLAWQLAEDWKIGLLDWPEEADALKRTLRGGGLSASVLNRAAPHLARVVAPVWLASPYEVPSISDELAFDAVVLVDAGTVTLAETLGAIRRAKQLVAVGDPVTQTPSPFTTAVLQPDDPARTAPFDVDELHDRSALAQLSSLLPVLSLTRSYRAGGDDLAELVNRKFYGGRIDSLPWAGSFLGHNSLALDYVENGTGLPDTVTGAVESVDAEVNRVVDLVIEHVTTRPRESLMVVTANERHAVRVQQAVLSAVGARPELTDALLGDRPEPFAVTTIDRALAQSRDRVIFSLGYGRTPHGRVLSDFGALGRPGGERLLAVAMTRARRSLVIVTCFRPADVDEGRMQHGAIALAEILDEIADRRDDPPQVDASDPMLVDLGRRLAERGLRVALGHRGKLGLVAANGGTCVVVDTDAALLGRSLRESLRLRPEVLRRLGWHYARVHAFELFADPDGVADRIARLAGIATGGPITEEIPVVG
ncbi:AAA family ATPase [Schumannella sp. 10F1B-5-1]|uniref:AAA family ATPase n=1 Tax=Schumannella sp. 10F1B-5-1 TaxID=2590780 RepID=UPI0021084AC2|nr:AAA family ATPase [Schumannella sp. 10F1B-5-1]